jgi:O-antigen/teichoic acid export membrane protein
VRGLLREFSLIGLGTALSRGLSFLTLVVLTRHLDPPEFGAFSIGWVVYQIVSQLSSGIDLGYVDLESRRRTNPLYGAYFRIKLEVAVAMGFLAIAVPLACGAALGWSGPFTRILIVSGLAGAVTSVFQSNLSSFQAHREFGRFSFWTVFFNAGVAVCVVILVASGVRSPTVFLACYLLLGVATATALSILVRHDGSPGTRDERRLIVRHSRWLVVSSVLFSVGERIELLIAAAFLTEFELGIYSAPARMFGLLVLFLSSMGTVLMPRASRLRDYESFKAYIRWSIALTGGVGVFAVLVVLGAHPLTRLVLGESYTAAAELVPAFCAAAVLLTGQATVRYLFFSVGRPGAFAMLNGLVLAARVAAALILIPLLGAKGAAWSLASSYAVGALFIGAFVLGWRRSSAWESSAEAARASRESEGGEPDEAGRFLADP